MPPKWLKRNESESLRPLPNDLPHPGDFEIGSRASRAAARALLKAKSSGKQNPHRLVITCVGGPQVSKEASGKPRGATCSRSLWNDGQVFEFVDLCAGNVSEKNWTSYSRAPVDGKTYNLEEFRSKTSDASTGWGL